MEHNNKVYTYIENISQASGFETEVLALWKKTWSDNGWSPVILGRADADKHPRFKEFHDIVSEIKTPYNAHEYNLLCWLRWLAFAQVGGGFISDYDVMNIKLKPEDMLPVETVRICHTYGVPCFVQSSGKGAEEIIDAIMGHTPDYAMDGKNWNDMHFFIQSKFEKCLNGKQAWLENGSTWYEKDDAVMHSWEDLPIVHFSNASCDKAGFKNKITAIQQYLDTLTTKTI